jgi:hypothetical protein
MTRFHLQPRRLRLPLLNNLLRLFSPLLPQRNKHPKPRRQFQEPPRKHNAIVQRHVALAHHPIAAARRHHPALFEHVCVCCQGEQEQEAYGRLNSPVLVGKLFAHGHGGEVGEAEEGEEDAKEGD